MPIRRIVPSSRAGHLRVGIVLSRFNPGIGEIYPGTRSWVTFYVETPSIDASLADVARRGGKVVVPRTVMPDVTLAIFEDPEGHPIGLVETRTA